MKATLDLILFLLSGIATGAGTVIGAGGGICAAGVAGWLCWRRWLK